MDDTFEDTLQRAVSLLASLAIHSIVLFLVFTDAATRLLEAL